MVWTGRVNKRVAQVSGVRKGGRSKSNKLAVATKRAQALFLLLIWAFQGWRGETVLTLTDACRALTCLTLFAGAISPSNAWTRQHVTPMHN